MTRRQIVATVLAVVLAIGGVTSLVGYARGADERALAGAETQPVLQVADLVPAGTSASRLAGLVERVEMPAQAVVAGALTSTAQLTELTNRRTTVPLEPGEQVTASKLAAPVKEKASTTDVPAGMQEITVAVDLPGSVASTLRPGDLVGLIAGYGAQGIPTGQSGFAMQQVRVTATALGTQGDAGEDGEGQLDGMLVTVAVDGDDAVKVAHAARFGWITLTRQNEDTDVSGPETLTSKEVLP